MLRITDRDNTEMTKYKYQITGFQITYGGGQRDTIKLQQPVMVENIEEYRMSIRDRYLGVASVNLYYTEVPFEEFDEYDF